MKNVDWKQLEADFPEFRWDPSVVSYGSIGDPDPSREYWHRRTPQERLRYMEFLRRINYAYGRPGTRRVSRVVEVVSRP